MPRDERPSLLHLAALESVGGVERYLADLVGADRDPSRMRHVIAHRRGVHPLIEAQLPDGVDVFCRKRALGFKLPRKPPVVRDLWMRSQLKRRPPGLALVWNEVTDDGVLRIAKASGWRTAYWERGSGWHPLADEAPVRRMLGEVDVLLANSIAGKRILEERFGVDRDVTVLRNAVRPSALPPKLEPRTRRDGPLRIGVAGRLVPIKAPNLALYAAQELDRRGVPFTLSFAGTGALADELAALARSLGVDDKVHFRGLVDSMPDFFASIDVLLHPAIREPCANVAPEAQAFGLPVVATRVDGMPEVACANADTLLVDPEGSADEFTQLAASAGKLPAFVYDPTSDRIREPRFVRPERFADVLESLYESTDDYLEASRRAVREVERTCLPEHVLPRALDVLATEARAASRR